MGLNFKLRMRGKGGIFTLQGCTWKLISMLFPCKHHLTAEKQASLPVPAPTPILMVWFKGWIAHPSDCLWTRHSSWPNPGVLCRERGLVFTIMLQILLCFSAGLRGKRELPEWPLLYTVAWSCDWGCRDGRKACPWVLSPFQVLEPYMGLLDSGPAK